eukprot:Selendium_serpulae@DN6472_c0_g1_i5.p2
MFRGDDHSSKRIYDALQTGAINLMISDGVVPEVLPFQCVVPWLDMMYQIPEAVFNNDPIGTLNKFDAKFSESGSERASVSKTFDRINRHVADVVWDLEDSRVATNALFTAARKCLGYSNSRTPSWWKRHPKSNDAFRHVIRGVYHLRDFASPDRCHVRVATTTSYGPFND